LRDEVFGDLWKEDAARMADGDLISNLKNIPVLGREEGGIDDLFFLRLRVDRWSRTGEAEATRPALGGIAPTMPRFFSGTHPY
jgi:hypothetical protein